MAEQKLTERIVTGTHRLAVAEGLRPQDGALRHLNALPASPMRGAQYYLYSRDAIDFRKRRNAINDIAVAAFGEGFKHPFTGGFADFGDRGLC